LLYKDKPHFEDMLMKELVAGFTAQLREAITIGEGTNLQPAKGPIKNVVITGLGGSGIGGTIVSQLTDQLMNVPLLVNKDYFLPAFTGPETLVIVSSYSGNTEETVQAMQAAMDRGAQIACISSGGVISDTARRHSLNLITIPGGMPPRSCLGYSFVQLLFMLQHYGLTDRELLNDLNPSIALLEKENEDMMRKSHEMATSMHGKLPILYSDAHYEGVAVRWRQQINENGKMLCWHHVLPEMNHNELVGWTSPHPETVVVMLRGEDDYMRTQKRMEITEGVVRKYAGGWIDVHAKGETRLQRSLYLILLGDWISCHLADLREIDATEVRVIDHLKGELSKI
jgi:glucose/mannose-6-phosphate isomerase